MNKLPSGKAVGLAAALALACGGALAQSAYPPEGNNEAVGPGAAPQRPSDIRPTEQMPHTTAGPAVERSKKAAERQLKDWEARVGAYEQQARQRNDRAAIDNADQLNKELLTAKQSYQQLSQAQNEPAYDTARSHFDAAIDRLSQVWDNQVAEAR